MASDQTGTDPPPGDNRHGGVAAEITGAGGRTAILGALTSLIAVLTAVATVNGEVGRMFRNHWVATFLALMLILTSVLCVLLTQAGAKWSATPWLLVIGSVALVAGTAFALFAEVRTLALSDRPEITSTFEEQGTDVRFAAHVSTRKAQAHDQIVVVVYGVALDHQRTAPIYYAKTGPNTGGDLAQDVELLVDRATYTGVYLTAEVVPEDVRPPNVDCDGDIVGPDGKNLTSPEPNSDGSHTIPFRPNGHAPLVGCATIEFPPAPS